MCSGGGCSCARTPAPSSRDGNVMFMQTGFASISLMTCKEIDAKPVCMNITFPSRDDGAGVRAQEHPSPEHIPIDFVDIGYVECFDLVVTHFHGQVRPQSLNWITRQENHL